MERKGMLSHFLAVKKKTNPKTNPKPSQNPGQRPSLSARAQKPGPSTRILRSAKVQIRSPIATVATTTTVATTAITVATTANATATATVGAPSSRSVGRVCLHCRYRKPMYYTETAAPDFCWVCQDCLQFAVRRAVRAGRTPVCPRAGCGSPLGHGDARALDEVRIYAEAYTLSHPPEPQLDCIVCLTAQPISVFPLAPTSSCRHARKLCLPCIQQLLAHALSGSAWIDPRCPECSSGFTAADVQRFGTPAQSTVFADRATRRFLQSLPEYRECIAPGCGNSQLHDGGADRPIVTCRACGHKTCFNHRDTPWHVALSCEEYDEDIRLAGLLQSEGPMGERELALELSERLVREQTKPCPGCKFDIMKTGGCQHMTCGKCGFEFCWECKADYADIRRLGRKSHNEGCIYKV